VKEIDSVTTTEFPTSSGSDVKRTICFCEDDFVFAVCSIGNRHPKSRNVFKKELCTLKKSLCAFSVMRYDDGMLLWISRTQNRPLKFQERRKSKLPTLVDNVKI